MADIMKKDSRKNAFLFLVGYNISFRSEYFQRLCHQMHTSQRMLKSCMHSGWINIMRQSQLHDSSQPLKPWMFNEIKNEIVRDGDQPINRIADYLTLISPVRLHRFMFKYVKR